MFQWRPRSVHLMVSPLASPSSRQQYALVDVSVAEETTPVYALEFAVTHETKRIERRVTKQLMARVFERAIVLPRGHVATLHTRLLEKRDARADDAVDSAVRAWVCAETTRPPTREQLVKWLLSRMLLSKTSDNWTLALCGESDSEDPEEIGNCPASPPPPPYSAGSSRSDRTPSDSSDDPAFFDDIENDRRGDQGEAAPDFDQDGSILKDEELYGGHQMAQTRSSKLLPQKVKVARESSEGKLATDVREDCADLPVPSSHRFEPARERIDSQRCHSLSSSFTPPNAWTEERHHFQLELTQSKRDIAIAQERQRKARAIASVRRKRTVEQSQKKLLAHEQKLRDARAVKQGIADTLEYHDIACRMESQLKHTQIASNREQEKITQMTRIALGCSGDKWRKGPVIGSGPLSQIEIDLLTRGDRKPPAQPSMWVYDLHGRRHHESSASIVVAESVFDAAMKKIQRLLDRKQAESVDLFRTYDLDRSGTLEYGEFTHLLGDNGVEVSQEQAKTLFRHFDPNRSGAIDYGELLWGFFNRRAFLKRWKQRKTKLSPQEIKQMFYEYDRVGRGALAPLDFQLALDDIGFRVSESETKLLCLKFDANKDGFIDYNEFHAFVNDDIGEDSGGVDRSVHTLRRNVVKEIPQSTRGKSSDERSSPRVARRRSTNGNDGTGTDDAERILAELRVLNETKKLFVARSQLQDE